MIDKPKGKIEHFMEEALKWLREFAGDFKEVFSAGMEPINAGKKAHPRLARVVAAAALICVCGLVVVGFTRRSL